MGGIKDLYCRSYLIHKLLVVPPRITVRAWVNYFASITNYLVIFISKHKSTIFLVNEVGNVN